MIKRNMEWPDDFGPMAKEAAERAKKRKAKYPPKWRPLPRFARSKATNDPDEGPFTGPPIVFTGKNRAQRRKEWADFQRNRKHDLKKRYKISPPRSYY